MVFLGALGLYLVFKSQEKGDLIPVGEFETKTTAQFVGRAQCVQCHQQEYKDWEGSHHDRAMDHATAETVLGNFNDQSLEYNGMEHRLYKKDNRFYAYTDGPNGQMKAFEIKYVFGFYPLQQYLVEFDGGRLQTLPLTWDDVKKEWYHMAALVYKDEIIEHTNWLHWTNQAQNWNSMCADCHSTNLIKGYDQQTDTYQTTWSEMDVSCEACHGPASNHVEWASKAPFEQAEYENYGLTVMTSGINNQQFVDLCARCHTRRGTIADFDHSADIYDHMQPSLPTGEFYHIDGQILDEDYVYGSFTQSKMYKHKVQCNNCHNVHSTKLLFTDNRLCTQCHQASDYDTPSHHFHKTEGESGKGLVAADGVHFGVGDGAKCVNCHMPAQFYMGIDYRSDHSMRIPRPDLTQALGTPNACNQCHADKSTQWAIHQVNQWYGPEREVHYGMVFQQAAEQQPEAFEKLVQIYRDTTHTEVVKAVAIHYLGVNYQDRAKNLLLQATQHNNRHIAYNALVNLMLDDESSFQRILQLLEGPSKAIRTTAAQKLIGMPQEQIPVANREAFTKAQQEYLETLEYNGDFPTGKFNLGNYYYNIGEVAKAEQLYTDALRQDKELHAIKVNLALLYNAKGELDKTDAFFKNYLNYVPHDGETLFMYGLFLSERQQYDASLKTLIKAAEHAPDNARIPYNIAMLYDFKNNPRQAEDYLKKAIAISPEDVSLYNALLNRYTKYGETQKAKALAQEMLQKFPDLENNANLKNILGQLP